MSPIVAFNFGAQNHEELKNVLKKSLIILFSVGLLMFGISEALKIPLCHVFIKDEPELFEITKRAIEIFSFSFIFTGIGLFTSSFFTSLNNGLISALVSSLRMFVYQILCILVLPILLGVNGIWLASVVSELLAFITSFIFIICNKKKYCY